MEINMSAFHRLRSRSKTKSKAKVGDVIVTHYVRALMSDGETNYFWFVTNSFEEIPTDAVPPECPHGPYASKTEASAAADQAIREYLGPQCEIEDRPGWPEKPHPVIQ
jgi:hypothetical protein